MLLHYIEIELKDNNNLIKVLNNCKYSNGLTKAPLHSDLGSDKPVQGLYKYLKPRCEASFKL